MKRAMLVLCLVLAPSAAGAQDMLDAAEQGPRFVLPERVGLGAALDATANRPVYRVDAAALVAQMKAAEEARGAPLLAALSAPAAPCEPCQAVPPPPADPVFQAGASVLREVATTIRLAREVVAGEIAGLSLKDAYALARRDTRVRAVGVIAGVWAMFLFAAGVMFVMRRRVDLWTKEFWKGDDGLAVVVVVVVIITALVAVIATAVNLGSALSPDWEAAQQVRAIIFGK